MDDVRLVIRDILLSKIEEINVRYDWKLMICKSSTSSYYSGKYLKELNYSLFDLVLLTIWWRTNQGDSITICVQNEEIIIIGHSFFWCLRKRISLHQQDCVEQTIRIISEVIASILGASSCH